jgi:hypothetical protein
MKKQYATQALQFGGAADEVRVETLRGREYVVATAVLVREMVLKGEFLPFDEIEQTQLAWNAKPLTISHPRTDEGEFIPASTPSQFESHVAGMLFGVEARSARSSLEGEVWFDRERSAQVADELGRDDPAEQLLDGETVEGSVGYWYETFPTEGEVDGDEFNAVQVNVQPDHYAALPNAEGECSVGDGCGIGRDDDAGATLTDNETTLARLEARDDVSLATAVQGDPHDTRGRSLIQRGLSALGVDTTDHGCSSGPCWCGEHTAQQTIAEPDFDGFDDSEWEAPTFNGDGRLGYDGDLEAAQNAAVVEFRAVESFADDHALWVVDGNDDVNVNALNSSWELASQVEGPDGESLSDPDAALARAGNEDLAEQAREDGWITDEEWDDRWAPRIEDTETTTNTQHMSHDIETLAEQTEFDEEALRDMNDEQLDALEATLDASDQSGGDGGTGDGTGGDGSGDADDDVTDMADQIASQVTDEVMDQVDDRL